MEEYTFNSIQTIGKSVVLGHYFAKIHEKHVLSYGEGGADNIVNNTVETYERIQEQISNGKTSNNVLLVGKVQSGKTSNLELLTAIAFDNGYNVLVIYGGYDTGLLKQTTDRFKTTFDVVGEVTYDGEGPAIFTTDDSTQILSIDDEIMTDLLENGKPVIFVSMKRPAAMKKINKLFRRLDKSKFKAFIIDDEGDQASLNTSKDKIKNASATYKQITDMKLLLEDPMYLSVTATPQANIFLDQWSELRPDSIRIIQPGVGYDGAQIYHCSDNNIVEIVPDEDNDEMLDGNIPQSLWYAVRYFVVASAIKGKRALNGKERYSDMIVHAFRETVRHKTIYSSIESYIKSIKDSFECHDDDEYYYEDFEECYNKYVDDSIKSVYSFNDIKPEIEKVVRKTKVILKDALGKNSQTNENLKWHKIYVGGDLLQRGLTFPNLITTYFTRWAASGGNMDTNLQRARWFGYREKYIDLCKIFTTGKIAMEFSALTEIEDDLWEQFSEVENGNLKIEDILIQADNTKQSPTSKQRVTYKKVTFKNRWIKQKYIVEDIKIVISNNEIVSSFVEKADWENTSVGSRLGNKTAQVTFLKHDELLSLLTNLKSIFDVEPFHEDALTNLIDEDGIPVIFMCNEEKSRYRSMYDHTNQIKVLQQGADSTDLEKIDYEGDSNVIVDRERINIQIYRVTPGYSRNNALEAMTQYMFAVYLPKEKSYFVKGDE